MSTSSSQLLADVAQLHADSDVLHSIVHGPAAGQGSIVQTDGGPVKTAARAIAAVQDAADVAIADIRALAAAQGYQVPVAYAAGIEMTTASQTVEYNGQAYAPILEQLPFTTSGTFEVDKFRLIQGVSAGDLSAAAGASLVGFMQDGDGAILRDMEAKAKERKTSGDWGAFGILSLDATSAITKALLKWRDTGCGLEILEGKHHISSPIVIEMDGVDDVGEILMRGALVPDPGIGRAITIRNARGGTYTLRARDGGQAADYTQANPAGADEAFAFVNCYGGIVHVAGQNYAGRLLRITSDTPGSGGFQTQWMDVRYLRCNSSAPITADESVCLARGVGQAFYIDTGTNAFGRFRHADMAWETYGSVIENTSDVTFDHAETIYRGNTGMQLRGVISFWGGTLNLGSEKANWTSDLLYIGDSSTRNSQQVKIHSLFANGGYNGLNAVNIGVTAGQGLSIDNVFTRNNTNRGILLNNCRKLFMGNAECNGDTVSLELAGGFNLGEININSIQSKLQSIIVDSTVTGDVTFRGSATNGNFNGAASTSLIDIETTAPIFFDKFIASSGNVDYLYRLPTGNTTRIEGGQVVTVGSTAIFNNQPNRATNVVGWQTANKGNMTIPAGQTSVVVNHGLVRAPDYVSLLVTSAIFVRVAAPKNLRTATQFTIQIEAAQATDFSIDWKAETNYSG